MFNTFCSLIAKVLAIVQKRLGKVCESKLLLNVNFKEQLFLNKKENCYSLI